MLRSRRSISGGQTDAAVWNSRNREMLAPAVGTAAAAPSPVGTSPPTVRRSASTIRQKLATTSDVPSPSETCFVENLHSLVDIAAFAARTCQLAEKNHGWAGRELGTKFVRALRSDREQLEGCVEVARAAYVTAADGITSSWRDLVRVHGRFATIYASGCVAIRFGVLPFTPEELLSAILMCERDHVAFVDQEVRRLRALVLPAPGTQKAVAAIVAPRRDALGQAE
jgi:hypothetical protein